MATQKTANDYREERKARIAKNAKKSSKKPLVSGGAGTGMKQSTKNAIYAIIAGVIVIAIAAVSCYNLGVFERFKTIKVTDGDSYSAVEYEYYYKSIHYYYYNMSSQYDSYYGAGYGAAYTGYDCSKLPEDQTYKGSDYTLPDGSEPTWQQYFEYLAAYNLKRSIVLEDMAVKAGFVVSDEATSEAAGMLDQLRDNIKEQAASSENGGNVTSLGKYLRLNYGNGMTENIFQRIVDRETVANEYYAQYLEDTQEKYTDKEIQAVYDKDKTLYDSIDFRMFTVSAETPDLAEDATTEETEAAQKTAAETAKKNANEMFGRITDEASFIKLAEEYATDTQKESYDYTDPKVTLSTSVEKNAIASSFSEDTIKWLYSADTKVGDKKLFDNNGTYYIFYMIKTSYLDETLPVDVRHILYQFDAEATDAEADKEQCKASAETALKKIQDSKYPLDTFTQICTSESEDTGSAENGGLYEKVGKGEYVESFEKWALDPARKEGDVGIVESSYGYHVMYFVKHYDKPVWKLTICETLANDEVTKLLEGKMDSDTYSIKVDGKDQTTGLELNNTVKKLNDKIYNEICSTYYSAQIAEKATAEGTTAA